MQVESNHTIDDTGVLLVAIGSDFYGQLAFNMANSLKLSSPTTKIALVADGVSLNKLLPYHKQRFDHIISAKEGDCRENHIVNPFKLKTYLYDYTPFENTLYLDVDGLFLHPYKKFDDLIYSLKDIDFQMHEVRRWSYEDAPQSGMVWTKTGANKGQRLQELWGLYDIDKGNKYPEYNSSFIWFKKTDANREYFANVKKCYMDRRFTGPQLLGKSYPDEMAWNITGAQMGYYGKVEGYRPIYFNWQGDIRGPEELSKDYWFIGMAAGFQPSKLLAMYNNIAKRNSNAIGDRFFFKFDQQRKIFFRK